MTILRNPRVQLLTIAGSLSCCLFIAGLSAYLTSQNQFSTVFNVATGSDFGISITGQDPTEPLLPGDTVTSMFLSFPSTHTVSYNVNYIPLNPYRLFKTDSYQWFYGNIIWWFGFRYSLHLVVLPYSE